MKRQYSKRQYKDGQRRCCDVVVIGSGPAGMAAAVSAADAGASVCMIEREEKMGGILKQCIHDGFGLIRFEEKLTGPEYSWRYQQMVNERDIDFLNLTFLTKIERSGKGFSLEFVNPAEAVISIEAASVVMAMGCRERTDRQIFLHGQRPAGIFTAGQAQDFINLKGFMPGKRPVILGSGDIGLIMARRFTLEGASVRGVYEIASLPSGLTRNVVQCLEDFDIPLHLNTTVTEVHGRDRVEAVTVCRVDENRHPLQDTARRIDCDCLILSVGLIPENDILIPLGIELDPVTRGPVVDQFMHSSCPGIFSCGNALHVSDLVDYVSESGHAAGKAAAEWTKSDLVGSRKLRLSAGGIIQYIVPQSITEAEHEDSALPVYFRPSVPADRAEFLLKQSGRILYKKRFSYLKPSEMQRLEIDFARIDPEGEMPVVELTALGMEADDE
ncbi:MAG TPA: pyridine nucleotide-disulfide oxidoreductase [Spirochaeta sp.]|nr:pyridine nucleotide-disulfide oxidoreductase [Spirochaeta sp.]